MPSTRNPRYMSSFMAAKVMAAKNNRNVGSHSFGFFTSDEQPTAGLQLRRAISIQPKRKKLLEKHAIAPSAARLC